MEISDFLLDSKKVLYDFSQYPNFLFFKKNNDLIKNLRQEDTLKIEQWSKLQKSFVEWTQNKEVL